MLFSFQRGLAFVTALSLLAGCELPAEPAPGQGETRKDPVKFNRNIDAEAHQQMERLLTEGISAFAFHPDGGWVIITEQGSKFARNIPEECNDKLEEFLAAGHEIRSIAFPPAGGNRWVIVTDRAKFARNIPSEANQRLETLLQDGHEVLRVAFPYERRTDNSWVIIAEDTFYARNIDDEAYQTIRNFMQRPRAGAARSRPVHDVAFEPGGGWVVLAQDAFYARNIDGEAYQKLGDFSGQARQIAILAFDPDGDGWSIISNERYSVRPEPDEIRTFESDVGGETLSQRRRGYNVPGVSVAVVVDNRLAWSAGYGHLAQGSDDAAHPESLYQAASISKVLAAIGVHKLVDDGQIALDDDILDVLSVSVPTRDCLSGNPAIELLQVLRHRSPVMGGGTTFPESACSNFVPRRGGGYGGYPAGTSVPTLNQIIAGSGPANSPPITRSRSDSTYSYSGAGYTLLQKLVEDLTGRSFSDWMEDEILAPMGMDDSFFRISVPQAYFAAGQVAAGHDSAGARIAGDRNQYPEYAAAGLYSTAHDLARVIIMLNDGGRAGSTRILSQASRDNMVENAIGIFRNDGAGSVTASANYYAHGGTNSGFRSLLVGFPDLGAGVVVMTNGDATGPDFREEVVQAVIDAYGW